MLIYTYYILHDKQNENKVSYFNIIYIIDHLIALICVLVIQSFKNWLA